MTRLTSLLLALLCFVPLPLPAKDLLLTGQVSSAQKQIVNAPRASRWQIQIQWMAEEGSIVQQGDLLVVFDGANEQARLEQNQETLERLQLELTQLSMTQDQLVMDALGKLRVSKMQVNKASIEASVPASEVSQYDKGQYDLALQKAMLEQVKAEEAHKRAMQERKAQLNKKNIDIQKTEEEIIYLQSLLSKLSVSAEVTGPVNYAMHPWNGSKLAAGTNVQASWKVADIQAIDDFQIETWVHEVDAIGIEEQSPVTLVIDAYSERTFMGYFEILSTQAEKKAQWSKSAYYPAIIKFQSTPDIPLLPGMSVRVEVNKGVASRG